MKAIDRPPAVDLVILGAGPVGLEAAARAGESGRNALVLERGDAGAHVRRWGSVRLFSPFGLNAGPAGLRALRRAGRPLPDADDILTGREFLERYLEPLASELRDTVEVRTGARAIGVSRDGWLKAEALGLPARAEKPFRILYERADREEEILARAIFDCTGTFARPGWAGPGGAPARGERRLRDRIAYRLPDLDRDRPLFATGRTLLIGAGHSAATAAVWLSELAASGDARFVWSTRGPAAEGPLAPIADDPLPERAALTRRANAVARRPPAGSDWIPESRLREVAREGDGFEVLLDGREPRRERFDRILALVGYEPDDGLYRQLQVHECYASRAPMKLAAALLAATGDGPADCLADGGFEAATLENPEPDFFILGAKSYGKNSAFLMRTGYEQIEDAFSLLAPGALDPVV